jgi:hypothetical protein
LGFLDPSNSIGDLSITTISTQNTGDSSLIDIVFGVSKPSGETMRGVDEGENFYALELPEFVV